MLIRELINELITQSKKATPQQLAQMVKQAALAPFAEDLLEVDEPLWGGFWQGDVIAPGYSLPAVELALLRATRLDATWPEGTTASQFLADLCQAVFDSQAGVWTLAAAGEPCVVFASVSSHGSGVSSQKSAVGSQRSTIENQRSAACPATKGSVEWVSGRRSVTVVWYCATTDRLHAGYRTGIRVLGFEGAVEQRPLEGVGAVHLEEGTNLGLQPGWLEQVSAQAEAGSGRHLAARLDAAILRIRHQMGREQQ